MVADSCTKGISNLSASNATANIISKVMGIIIKREKKVILRIKKYLLHIRFSHNKLNMQNVYKYAKCKLYFIRCFCIFPSTTTVKISIAK